MFYVKWFHCPLHPRQIWPRGVLAGDCREGTGTYATPTTTLFLQGPSTEGYCSLSRLLALYDPLFFQVLVISPRVPSVLGVVTTPLLLAPGFLHHLCGPPGSHSHFHSQFLCKHIILILFHHLLLLFLSVNIVVPAPSSRPILCINCKNPFLLFLAFLNKPQRFGALASRTLWTLFLPAFASLCTFRLVQDGPSSLLLYMPFENMSSSAHSPSSHMSLIIAPWIF